MLKLKIFTFNFIICCLFHLFLYSQKIPIKIQFLDTINKITYPIKFSLDKTTYETNQNGFFETEIEKGEYILLITDENYYTIAKKILVNEDNTFFKIIVEQIRQTDNIEIITDFDLETEETTTSYADILTSKGDFYYQITNYTFSTLKHKNRNYSYKQSNFYINGLPIYDYDSESSDFLITSGLNNITRYAINNYGIESNVFGLNGLNGNKTLNIEPYRFSPVTTITYVNSNVSYDHQIRLTQIKHFSDNKFNYIFCVSKRYGDRGYIKGTWYDGTSLVFAIDKQISDRIFSFTLLSSKIKQALSSAATKETFELLNTNFYNPNWGYQTGDNYLIKRNAKIKDYFNNLISFNCKTLPQKNTTYSITIGYNFGNNNLSGLNWYNAPDPRPDYYKYLPSYYSYDSTIYSITKDYWTSSPNIYQINWNQLYYINYLSNLENKPARYILENKCNDFSFFKYSFNTLTKLNKKITINFGLYGSYGYEKYYKKIKDLLGANYWLDIDQFTEREFPDNDSILYNDLLNPNKILKEGDIFGYNYKLLINDITFWSNINLNLHAFKIDIKPFTSYINFYRYGYMKNGRFPNESYGKSKTFNFIDYGINNSIKYFITLRHILGINLLICTNRPNINGIFINPKINNKTISDIKNEQISSIEANYHLIEQKFRLKLTGYLTEVKNKIEKLTFYHDYYQTFVDLTIKDLNEKYSGIEIAGEINIFKNINLQVASNLSKNIYTSRPIGYISYTNGAKSDTITHFYIKNFNIPGYQKILLCGISYTKKLWYFHIKSVFAADNYIKINPLRRTIEAVSNLTENDPKFDKIINQEKLPQALIFNLSIGKSFRLQDNFVSINLTINNLLNNQKIIAYGYEQLRFDYSGKKVDKFPPKYSYLFGRNYYFSITYKF